MELVWNIKITIKKFGKYYLILNKYSYWKNTIFGIDKPNAFVNRKVYHPASQKVYHLN